MPLHLSQLVRCVPGSGLQAELEQLLPVPPQEGPTSALLLGGTASGKTALLFQYALALASEGMQVYFVTRRGKVETGFPIIQGGGADNRAVLSRIKIRYLSSSEDLRKLGACLHLLPFPLGALIVDDIHDFLTSSDAKQELARTLASLKEAVLCLLSLHGAECALLVSASSQEEACASVYIARRWLPSILCLEGPEEKDGAVTLRLHPTLAAAAEQLPPRGRPLLRLAVSSSHPLQLQAVQVAG